MAASAGAQLLGGVLGGKAASKAAKEAAAIQQANFNQLKQQLEAIGIPSRVAQEIALTDPQYAGDLIAEQLGDTKLAEVSADPAMRQRRLEALNALEERSVTGLTAAEKAQMQELSAQVGAQAKAKDNAILSQMAQSGSLSSGDVLAQRLLASQAATQRQADASRDLAAQASNRRFSAIQALGEQAGNLEDIDYRRGTDIAGRRDAIAEANARNRMTAGQYNLGRKDVLESQRAANRSQEEMYNKGLIDKEYQNKMGQFNTLAGIQTGAATAASNAATQAGQGKAQMYSGIGQAAGSLASSYAQNQFNQQQADLNRQNALEIAKIQKGE